MMSSALAARPAADRTRSNREPPASWPVHARRGPGRPQRQAPSARNFTTRRKHPPLGDRPAFAGGLRLSPHHARESATSLTNEVRCGDAEGSLFDRGCEGRDLGATRGGGERGRDQSPARYAEADGEQVPAADGRGQAEGTPSGGVLPDLG